MPEIQLQTTIQADVKTVFDLARSIDLHVISSASTREKAIGGVTTGLIGQGEQVTWKAYHFGIPFTLTSEVTHCEPHYHFCDIMVSGPFEGFVHHHYFDQMDGHCRMTDVFTYSSPFGWLGRFADALFLKAYMKRFLSHRNAIIRRYAESEALWQSIPGMI